jgi:hypothetical protein
MGKYLALLRRPGASAPAESLAKSVPGVVQYPDSLVDLGRRTHQTEVGVEAEPDLDSLARADSGEQPGPMPSPLVAIADAIAAVPRSPVLNELALSRAAACFIAAERAAQAAPPALRAKIHQLAADAMTRVARDIHRSNYQAAYDALDILADKVRELRAH